MKHTLKRRIVFFYLISILSVLFMHLDQGQAAAAGISINKKSAALETGGSVQLSVLGTKSKVSWKTSKSSVATVSSSGKVTA
jgi:hypothetical protein